MGQIMIIKTKAGKELIHPTVVIHPGAEIDEGVEIGPYSIIGKDVKISKGTVISSHVTIDGWTSIGPNCRIYQFTTIGTPPQDIRYKGEKTEVMIGSNNVIMANVATLAGHVHIEDYAIIGGLVAIHQFVKIGAYSIIGGASAITHDVPPYVMAVGNRARLYGLNKVGLRRQGFTREEMDSLKKAYNMLFRSSLTLKEAIERVEDELKGSGHVMRLTEFIKGSKRGITRERGRRAEEDEKES